MSFDQMMLIVLKVMFPLLFGYAYLKFNKAKRVDNTLELKLKGRSMIEAYTLIALSVAFIAYPFNKDKAGFAVFAGAILFLLVYLCLERIVAVGRKVIYAKFYAFEVKQISKKTYEKGRFTFYIRNGKVKIFLPVADMNSVMQGLSGSNRRNRKRVK